MFSEITLKSKKYIEILLSPLKSKWYYFHNLYHTLDVFERVNYLIKKENINDDLAEMLQIAALFHDSGFLEVYTWHEKKSINQLDAFLKKNNLDYPIDRIDIISNIILSTEVWVKPNNILEKMIKDADLDNLWRDDFFEKTKNLREETKIILWKDLSLIQWYENTLKLMQNTIYQINTQILERQDKLKENIILLEQEIKNLKNV